MHDQDVASANGTASGDTKATAEAAGSGRAGLLQRKIQRRAQARKDAAEGGTQDETDAVYGGVWRGVAADDTPLVSDPARPGDGVVAKLKKGERIKPLDLGADATVNQGADAAHQWWKVTVMKGDHAGKEGWMLASATESLYQVKDEGTEQSRNLVGPGSATVKTGQQVDAGGKPLGDNVMSLSYHGADANQARWLQFIWREVIAVDDKGKATPQSGPITTTGGTYQLTEGGTADTEGSPKKENYNTDTNNASDPFYEAGGAADRTADSTTMMDQPTSANNQAAAAFDNGARRVVSRAHFTAFLVKGRKVTFQTCIRVEWKFAKKEEARKSAKGAYSVSGSGPADALPATIGERFHEQFPAFADLK